MRTWIHWLLTLCLFLVLADNICWWMGVPLCYREMMASGMGYSRVHLWLPKIGLNTGLEDSSVHELVWPNGQRASRPLPIKKPNNRRVLFVGCSYTYGYSVKDDETFVWRLNEQFPQVEFVNAGVSGFGALRSYKRACDLLPQQTYDLVVYAMIVNHLRREVYPKLHLDAISS